MRVLLAMAIGIGLLIGLFWPAGEPARVAAVTTAPARPQRTVVERSAKGGFYVTALVNGEPVQFMVDTGATTTALTLEDAQRAKIPFDTTKFKMVARTASGVGMGQKVHIAFIDLDGKRRDDVGGIVLEGLGESLLGQNFLSRLDAVEMTGDKLVLR